MPVFGRKDWDGWSKELMEIGGEGGPVSSIDMEMEAYMNIPTDEPVFLLLGRDPMAWKAVLWYGQLCLQEGLRDVAESAFRQAKVMQFRAIMDSKAIPDL